jgi:acyl carrier protein
MTSVEPDTRLHQMVTTVSAVLAELLAETRGEPPPAIAPTTRVTDLVVNSVQLLQFQTRLEDMLGVEITASALFDHETVLAFASYLQGLRS